MGYFRGTVTNTRSFVRAELVMSDDEQYVEYGVEPGWSSEDEGSLVSGTENGEPMVPQISGTDVGHGQEAADAVEESDRCADGRSEALGLLPGTCMLSS